MSPVEKIVSGGQTGVDRAAFDFALENGIAIGGYVPKGRRAEDGPIPSVYVALTETETRNYAQRTELNVLCSDATLVISRGALTGGSQLTKKIAEDSGKACLHIDLSKSSDKQTADETAEWLNDNNCRVLNIAGPRASSDPEIYCRTREFLSVLLVKSSFAHDHAFNKTGP